MEVTKKGRQRARRPRPRVLPCLGLHYSGSEAQRTRRDLCPSIGSTLLSPKRPECLGQPVRITHRYTVAARVSHHLILNLLPALQRLVYQHLAGMGESRGHKSREFLFGRSEARTKTTQGKGCPHQHRVAQSLSSCLGLQWTEDVDQDTIGYCPEASWTQRNGGNDIILLPSHPTNLFKRICRFAGGYVLADLSHHGRKGSSVLSQFDRLHGCPQDPDPVSG